MARSRPGLQARVILKAAFLNSLATVSFVAIS